MNGQVKVTWRIFFMISHSRLVHAIVLEAYIHFALMYTADHIFPVLLIKYLINKYGKRTTTYKLATGMKASMLYLRVLLFPCVVQKATAHVGKNALNIRYQAQKGVCGIFDGIPQHKKGYLVYVPHKWKIISFYNVVSDKSFSSSLTYTSQQYAEDMAMRPAVSYITYATFSRGESDYIFTFSQFE